MSRTDAPPTAPGSSRPTSSYIDSPETGEKTPLAIRAPATRRALRAADPLAAIPRDAELIGIALVKNECDIIEAFVRYNLRILDGLVILDHESSDNTRAILGRLQDEGLPLAVLSGDEAPLRQAQRTNLLPCLVIRPRCTVVSDSRWVGVNPAHDASCWGRVKRPMSPISATNTAPSTGPTPGICWIAR